jgi:hypothetical protein
VLANAGRWDEIEEFNLVIRELKAVPADELSDLTEVKAGIKELRDLITANHQEAILANEALAAKLNAKIDEVTAKFGEVAAALTKEIEQLAAAGSGGDATGLSVEQVDAAVARLEELAVKMQASADAAKADDPPV